MTMGSRRTIPALLLAAALVAAVAISAIAQADNEVAPAPEGAGAAQVTAVEPQAAEAVSALAEPRTGSDDMPADIEAQIDEHADFGMNPHLARRSVGGTSSVYLVPARDHVCAVITHGDHATASCPKTEEIAAGESGPGTVMLAGQAIGVYGVVPDGVASVMLAYGEGESRVVEATANAYLAVLPAGTPVGEVSYDGPGGPVEFRIYDPANVGTQPGE
jgi:hypothetical protein